MLLFTTSTLIVLIFMLHPAVIVRGQLAESDVPVGILGISADGIAVHGGRLLVAALTR